MTNPYIQIARPDHWFKNIFMVPGFALGLLIESASLQHSLPINIVVSLLSTCMAASANYTINEWLDAEFDKHHPRKKHRPSVSGAVKGHFVYLQWLTLAAGSIALSSLINITFALIIMFFLLMGILYNVKPFRTKDRIHLDILSESINNPLRFLLGWFAVNSSHFPPSSILLAYWMGGAFLMGVKRYSELRHIDNIQAAGKYRRSFQFYTEKTLLLSAFFYALSSAFFLGIFLIKYRIEYIVVTPVLALLFVWYLHIGMLYDSAAQRPEKLYQERGLMALLSLTIFLITALTFIDLPFLNILLETRSRG